MYDYLKVEGAERYECLNYLVISRSNLELAWVQFQSVFDSTIYELTKLHDEDWPFGVILVETSARNRSSFLMRYLNTMSLSMNADFVVCSICMFDGVFGGYDDLLADHISAQIYSVCFPDGCLNIATEDSLRNSPKWRSCIAESKIKMLQQI